MKKKEKKKKLTAEQTTAQEFTNVLNIQNNYLYTRDGDFTVGADGTLKTTSGDSVMGRNMNTGIMEPIFVGNNQYTLGANNILNVEGLANYQMVTADFEDYSTLKKVGDNYYYFGKDGVPGSRYSCCH